MNNEAIICLGGNTADIHSRIEAAEGFMATLGEVMASSGRYRTAPEYAGESEPYLNEVMKLSTNLDIEELRKRTKDYERAVREQNTAAPLVNLDIDIVVWNGTVIRPKDAVAAYFKQGLAKL